MMISDPDVWADPFGFSRIYTPLVLLAALDGMAIGSFMPGTAMLALAITTARARTGALPHRIEQVEFSSGVTLGDGAAA